MIRAVLDTSNHVKAVLAPSGASGALVNAWVDGYFELVCSESILEEISDVLRRTHIQRRYGGPPEELIEEYVAALRERSVMVAGDLALEGASPDPDDDHVLACALEGGAEFLVSADRAHLLSLGEFQGVRIVTAAELLAVLRAAYPEEEI